MNNPAVQRADTVPLSISGNVPMTSMASTTHTAEHQWPTWHCGLHHNPACTWESGLQSKTTPEKAAWLHHNPQPAQVGRPIVSVFISTSRNWSEHVRAPSASFRHDGTTIIIDFFSLFSLFLFFSLLFLPPSLFFQKGLS